MGKVRARSGQSARPPPFESGCLFPNAPKRDGDAMSHGFENFY
ncbi:MAG: hypothetical protein HSCHL_0041 [Hydrogenibacillus schlegelii]|uniref:Uncharacterized protein n=1 Tax=Hydrogenibacillus schlegelii TaxID=1484 RepID=A0A2T5G9C1_HYDSH|nr:MAG: hypothetical protein HSCHL_0041 [Hydrogenibacillus schlegelii]